LHFDEIPDGRPMLDNLVHHRDVVWFDVAGVGGTKVSAKFCRAFIRTVLVPNRKIKPLKQGKRRLVSRENVEDHGLERFTSELDGLYDGLVERKQGGGDEVV
jgi:hypothetical protein